MRFATCVSFVVALAVSCRQIGAGSVDIALETGKGDIIFYEGFEQDPTKNERQLWKVMSPALTVEHDGTTAHEGRIR